MIYSNMVYVAS